VPLAAATHNDDEWDAAEDVPHVAEGVPVVQDEAPGMETLKVEETDVLSLEAIFNMYIGVTWCFSFKPGHVK
jgi:hypothetical protein